MAIYLFLWIPEEQTDFLTYLPLVTMTMLSISTHFIIQVVCELWREGEVETWHVRLCQRLESPKESRKEGFTPQLYVCPFPCYFTVQCFYVLLLFAR